jgi:hypothetical protein
MNKTRIRHTIALAAISIGMLASSTVRPCYVVQAQDDSKTEKTKKDKSQADKANKKKEKRQVLGADEVKGQPVLWKEPSDISRRDLFYGEGGKDNAPDLSAKFTFMGRDKSGTSEKIYVKDSTGKEWIVKFGPEAKPETAATRIVWAVGYHVDRDYFVKSVHIEGRGGFEARDVRFKLRHAGYKEEGLWKWEVNPFLGTRELDGLKVLMALLNNWDLKTDNNKIARPDKKSGEHDEAFFYVADLGASFGTTGSIARTLLPFGDAPAGSKGDPTGYARQPFIDGVQNGAVIFHYRGKDRGALRGISVEHARWMGNLLAQLSDDQLSDAFRAAGWGNTDVATLRQATRSRIQQLQNLK